MINHIRTLLYNEDYKPTDYSQYFGAEIIPNTYRQIKVPAVFNPFFTALYGYNPDSKMKEYRLSQLLPFIHQPLLLPFTLKFDDRITYSLNKTYPDSLFKPDIKRVKGTITDTLEVIGKPFVIDESGQVEQRYFIDVLTTNTIKVKNQKERNAVKIYEYTLEDNGLSHKLPLGSSGYFFVINTTNPGSEWDVRIHVRPSYDPIRILERIKNLDETFFTKVFGTFLKEPYDFFYQLWTKEDKGLQLGAILLATSYRLEELRNDSL
jgi:hypothetical protein